MPGATKLVISSLASCAANDPAHTLSCFRSKAKGLRWLRPKVKKADVQPAKKRMSGRLLGARHWFEDAIEEAGIPHFTWHSLRHTFASRLVMAGVDLRTVAELMGHKKIQMTMRYSHLVPAHKLAAVDKLAASNAIEEAGQVEESADILLSGEPEKPIDTTTDTALGVLQ